MAKETEQLATLEARILRKIAEIINEARKRNINVRIINDTPTCTPVLTIRPDAAGFLDMQSPFAHDGEEIEDF